MLVHYLFIFIMYVLNSCEAARKRKPEPEYITSLVHGSTGNDLLTHQLNDLETENHLTKFKVCYFEEDQRKIASFEIYFKSTYSFEWDSFVGNKRICLSYDISEVIINQYEINTDA